MKLIKLPIYLYQLFSKKRRLSISFDYVQNVEKKNFGIDLLTNNFRAFEKNAKVYQTIIGIDGICACSGSSAITDFLGEFSSCTSIGGVDPLENPARGSENGFEVDFFRDAHGVLELEKICDFDCNRILGEGIQDFINLVESNIETYSNFYGDYYLKQTQQFLLKILDLFFVLNDSTNCYYVKKLTKNEYRSIAKEYITSLLENIPSEKNLVLDNILSITNPKDDILSQYFGSYKLLLSKRDPRDVYTTARTYPAFDLGYIPKDPHDFVKYYNWYINRDKYKYNPNVLLVQFEDFVNNYDDVSKKIMDFLNLKENEHVNKFTYFNPNVSINNIGIYKKYKDQDAIKIIETELTDHLYE